MSKRKTKLETSTVPPAAEGGAGSLRTPDRVPLLPAQAAAVELARDVLRGPPDLGRFAQYVLAAPPVPAANRLQWIRRFSGAGIWPFAQPEPPLPVGDRAMHPDMHDQYDAWLVERDRTFEQWWPVLWSVWQIAHARDCLRALESLSGGAGVLASTPQRDPGGDADDEPPGVLSDDDTPGRDAGADAEDTDDSEPAFAGVPVA